MNNRLQRKATFFLVFVMFIIGFSFFKENTFANNDEQLEGLEVADNIVYDYIFPVANPDNSKNRITFDNGTDFCSNSIYKYLCDNKYNYQELLKLEQLFVDVSTKCLEIGKNSGDIKYVYADGNGVDTNGDGVVDDILYAPINTSNGSYLFNVSNNTENDIHNVTLNMEIPYRDKIIAEKSENQDEIRFETTKVNFSGEMFLAGIVDEIRIKGEIDDLVYNEESKKLYNIKINSGMSYEMIVFKDIYPVEYDLYEHGEDAETFTIIFDDETQMEYLNNYKFNVYPEGAIGFIPYSKNKEENNDIINNIVEIDSLYINSGFVDNYIISKSDLSLRESTTIENVVYLPLAPIKNNAINSGMAVLDFSKDYDSDYKDGNVNNMYNEGEYHKYVGFPTNIDVDFQVIYNKEAFSEVYTNSSNILNLVEVQGRVGFFGYGVANIKGFIENENEINNLNIDYARMDFDGAKPSIKNSIHYVPRQDLVANLEEYKYEQEVSSYLVSDEYYFGIYYGEEVLEVPYGHEFSYRNIISNNSHTIGDNVCITFDIPIGDNLTIDDLGRNNNDFNVSDDFGGLIINEDYGFIVDKLEIDVNNVDISGMRNQVNPYFNITSIEFYEKSWLGIEKNKWGDWVDNQGNILMEEEIPKAQLVLQGQELLDLIQEETLIIPKELWDLNSNNKISNLHTIKVLGEDLVGENLVNGLGLNAPEIRFEIFGIANDYEMDLPLLIDFKITTDNDLLAIAEEKAVSRKLYIDPKPKIEFYELLSDKNILEATPVDFIKELNEYNYITDNLGEITNVSTASTLHYHKITYPYENIYGKVVEKEYRINELIESDTNEFNFMNFNADGDFDERLVQGVRVQLSTESISYLDKAVVRIEIPSIVGEDGYNEGFVTKEVTLSDEFATLSDEVYKITFIGFNSKMELVKKELIDPVFLMGEPIKYNHSDWSDSGYFVNIKEEQNLGSPNIQNLAGIIIEFNSLRGNIINPWNGKNGLDIWEEDENGFQTNIPKTINQNYNTDIDIPYENIKQLYIDIEGELEHGGLLNFDGYFETKSARIRHTNEKETPELVAVEVTPNYSEIDYIKVIGLNDNGEIIENNYSTNNNDWHYEHSTGSYYLDIAPENLIDLGIVKITNIYIVLFPLDAVVNNITLTETSSIIELFRIEDNWEDFIKARNLLSEVVLAQADYAVEIKFEKRAKTTPFGMDNSRYGIYLRDTRNPVVYTDTFYSANEIKEDDFIDTMVFVPFNENEKKFQYYIGTGMEQNFTDEYAEENQKIGHNLDDENLYHIYENIEKLVKTYENVEFYVDEAIKELVLSNKLEKYDIQLEYKGSGDKGNSDLDDLVEEKIKNRIEYEMSLYYNAEDRNKHILPNDIQVIYGANINEEVEIVGYNKNEIETETETIKQSNFPMTRGTLHIELPLSKNRGHNSKNYQWFGFELEEIRISAEELSKFGQILSIVVADADGNKADLQENSSFYKDSFITFNRNDIYGENGDNTKYFHEETGDFVLTKKQLTKDGITINNPRYVRIQIYGLNSNIVEDVRIDITGKTNVYMDKNEFVFENSEMRYGLTDFKGYWQYFENDKKVSLFNIYSSENDYELISKTIFTRDEQVDFSKDTIEIGRNLTVVSKVEIPRKYNENNEYILDNIDVSLDDLEKKYLGIYPIVSDDAKINSKETAYYREAETGGKGHEEYLNYFHVINPLAYNYATAMVE